MNKRRDKDSKRIKWGWKEEDKPLHGPMIKISFYSQKTLLEKITVAQFIDIEHEALARLIPYPCPHKLIHRARTSTRHPRLLFISSISCLPSHDASINSLIILKQRFPESRHCQGPQRAFQL